MSSPKTKLVYILASRYSGSTLLSFVLGTHPEIATIGELKKIHAKMIAQHGSAKHCSCGKLFLECDFWLQILNNLQSKYQDENFNADFSQFEFFRNKRFNQVFFRFCLWLSPTAHRFAFFNSYLQQKLSKFLDYNYNVIKTVNQNSGKSIFLDSSKPLKNLLYLSLDKRYELYVLHLIRDPRGQINSCLKYNKWTLRKATKKWIQTLETQLIFLTKSRLKYKTILYEEFCKNPEDKLQELKDFIGLSTHFELTNFRKGEQHIMGNHYMRLGKTTEIKERLDWLESFSEQEHSYIKARTNKYQKYYTTSVS